MTSDSFDMPMPPVHSMQSRLAGCAGHQVDELPGAPDEAKANEGGADATLRHLHGALVVADHTEVHEARRRKRDGRDQAGDGDRKVENRGEEGGDATDVHSSSNSVRNGPRGASGVAVGLSS